MSINRFQRPLQGQYTPYEPLNTYVDQYVPLPDMSNMLDATQLDYDVSDAALIGMTEMEFPFLKKDEEAANMYRQDIENFANDTIEKYGGDLAKARPEIEQYARDLKRSMSQHGRLGNIIRNAQSYNEYVKQIDKALEEGTISADRANALKAYSYNQYQGVGGEKDIYGSYNRFSGLDPAVEVDGVELVNEMVKDWASDEFGTSKVETNPDGSIMITKTEDGSTEYISASEVYNAISPMLRQNRQLMSMLNQDALLNINPENAIAQFDEFSSGLDEEGKKELEDSLGKNIDELSDSEKLAVVRQNYIDQQINNFAKFGTDKTAFMKTKEKKRENFKFMPEYLFDAGGWGSKANNVFALSNVNLNPTAQKSPYVNTKEFSEIPFDDFYTNMGITKEKKEIGRVPGAPSYAPPTSVTVYKRNGKELTKDELDQLRKEYEAVKKEPISRYNYYADPNNKSKNSIAFKNYLENGNHDTSTDAGKKEAIAAFERLGKNSVVMTQTKAFNKKQKDDYEKWLTDPNGLATAALQNSTVTLLDGSSLSLKDFAKQHDIEDPLRVKGSKEGKPNVRIEGYNIASTGQPGDYVASLLDEDGNVIKTVPVSISPESAGLLEPIAQLGATAHHFGPVTTNVRIGNDIFEFTSHLASDGTVYVTSDKFEGRMPVSQLEEIVRDNATSYNPTNTKGQASSGSSAREREAANVSVPTN